MVNYFLNIEYNTVDEQLEHFKIFLDLFFDNNEYLKIRKDIIFDEFFNKNFYFPELTVSYLIIICLLIENDKIITKYTDNINKEIKFKSLCYDIDDYIFKKICNKNHNMYLNFMIHDIVCTYYDKFLGKLNPFNNQKMLCIPDVKDYLKELLDKNMN